MATLWYRNLRLCLLTCLMVVVGGSLAFDAMPRREDPKILGRVAWITTLAPGLSATEVDRQVTEKIEAALSTFPDLRSVESASARNASLVVLRLHDHVLASQLPGKFAELRQDLAALGPELPSLASPPRLENDRFGAHTMILSLRSCDRSAVDPLLELAGIEVALRKLRSLRDLQQFTVYGMPELEVRFDVDLRAVAAVGLDLDALYRQLKEGQSLVPPGAWRLRGMQVAMGYGVVRDQVQYLRSLTVRAPKSRTPVRLDSLGDLRIAEVDAPSELARVDGRRQVLVALRMRDGLDVEAWSEGVRAQLSSVSPELDGRVAIDIYYDQAEFTVARFHGLAENLAFAFGLVAVVLLLMLGLRPALLVAFAIPLCAMGTLAMMAVFDVSLHQISVTGLIVALGLVVDNSIIVVDAVRRGLRQGRTPADAVAAAVRSLALPLTSSTLTTAMAFIPILLMRGRTGEFVGSLGASVIIAIVVSLLLSLTVIAGLAARWIGTGGPSERSSHPRAVVEQRSRALMLAILRRPWSMGLWVCSPAILGFVLAAQLPGQFFPPADRAQLSVRLHADPDRSIVETEEEVRKAEAVIAAMSGVHRQLWTLGRSAPAMYYNIVEDRRHEPAFAEGRLVLDGVDQVTAIARELQRRLDGVLLATRAIVLPEIQGPPVPAPIEARIYGSDPRELQRLGRALAGRLAELPELAAVFSPGLGTPIGLHLAPHGAELSGRGQSPRAFSHQLRAHLQGLVVSAGQLPGVELPLRLRPVIDGRAPIEVDDLGMLNMGGGALGGAVKVGLDARPILLRRRDGQQVLSVLAFHEAGLLPSVAMTAVREALAVDPIELSPGYRIEFAGDREERLAAQSELARAVVPLVLAMISVLVLTFRSFRLAGLVFLVAALSAGFGGLSLALFRYPLGFTSLMGALGLLGIAVNDAVVVLAALRNNLRASEGDLRAIAEVVVDECSLHVIATTVTSAAGFLPLLLAGGGFWPPFAAVMIGGVCFSSALALILVPLGYRWYTLARANVRATE